MLVGYARVSTQDQTLDLQKDALEKAGCTKLFTDTASGTKAERKGLEEAFPNFGVTVRLGICFATIKLLVPSPVASSSDPNVRTYMSSPSVCALKPL